MRTQTYYRRKAKLDKQFTNRLEGMIKSEALIDLRGLAWKIKEVKAKIVRDLMDEGFEQTDVIKYFEEQGL